MKKENHLFKGEIVQCPSCKLEIAEITRDLHDGEILAADVFKGKHREILDGEEAICPECKTPWGAYGGIHLTTGWTYE